MAEALHVPEAVKIDSLDLNLSSKIPTVSSRG